MEQELETKHVINIVSLFLLSSFSFALLFLFFGDALLGAGLLVIGHPDRVLNITVVIVHSIEYNMKYRYHWINNWQTLCHKMTKKNHFYSNNFFGHFGRTIIICMPVRSQTWDLQIGFFICPDK